MSGKHGQLSIASAVSGRPSYTYVDPNLYMRGPYTSEHTTYYLYNLEYGAVTADQFLS